MKGGDTGWQALCVIDIDASAADIWAIVSDFNRHPRLAGSEEVREIRMAGVLAPGTVFEADITTGEVGSFVSRNEISEVDPLRRLAWISRPPLDEGETEDHQIEVHWALEIVPMSESHSELWHSVSIKLPNIGAKWLTEFFSRTERMATVSRGMVRTLENIKREAEAT